MHAADAKTCDACVKAATAKAQAVRQFNCGFDLSDPRWGSGRSGHASWCKAASKDAVVAETAQRGQFKVCQLCRTYTDLATAAAADNANASCGFSGARWSAKAEDHFGWCMTRRNSDDATKAMATGSYTALTAVIEQLLGRETGERTLGMRAANCDSPLLRAAGREADRADDRNRNGGTAACIRTRSSMPDRQRSISRFDRSAGHARMRPKNAGRDAIQEERTHAEDF